MLGALMPGFKVGDACCVLVADDHVIIRRGLRNLLMDHLRPCEVHEAGSCAELLSQLPRRNHHLLLLDLQLGDGSAIDVVDRIRAHHPGLRVLVYSMGPERIYAQCLLRMGCSGYLDKQSSEEEVLRAVLQGRRYLSHELEMRFLQQTPTQGAASPDPFATLSDREMLVMEELLKGIGVKEIADRLHLQPTTVATYKARLFDKLGVSNVLDLQRLIEAHRDPRT